MAGGAGFDASGLAIDGRLDAALFGEAPSRIVVSTERRAALESLARERDVPLLHLGRVGGTRLVIGSHVDCAVDALREAYEGGLPQALGQGPAAFGA